MAPPSVRAGARRVGSTGVGAGRPGTVDRLSAIVTAAATTIGLATIGLATIVLATIVLATVLAGPGDAVRAALVTGIGVAAMVPSAVVDARTNRLPDRMVGAAALVTAAAWMLAAAVDVVGGSGPSVVGAALGDLGAGVLVTAGPLLALHLLAPAAMGFGDVKAAAVLGAAVAAIDWRLGLVVLALASAGAAAVALARRRSAIAFGPFLVGASWISVLAWIVGGLGTGTASALIRSGLGGVAP